MPKLMKELPVGSLVCDWKSYYSLDYEDIVGSPVVWLIADQSHEGYPENSTTLISHRVLAYGMYGGNNQYTHIQCYTRNWLRGSNPNATSNYLRTPDDTLSFGFQVHLSEAFRSAVLPTTIIVELPTKDGYEIIEATEDFFLPSEKEVGANSTSSRKDKYALFADYTPGYPYVPVLRSCPTELCAERTRHWSPSPGLNADAPCRWATRSGQRGINYTDKFTHVTDKGGIGSGISTDYYGVRPCCSVQNSLYVSDEPDGDGIYSIITGPVLQMDSGNLGEKSEAFELPYTVSSPGGELTIQEELDGETVREYHAEPGEELIFRFINRWGLLKAGEHTIRITAQSGGESDIKTITFTKLEGKLCFTLAEPVQTESPVRKAALCLLGRFPDGCSLTVEVCNNAFDPSPTWETVTEEVQKEFSLHLKNTDKTADKWGYNIRVEVNRKNAQGDCYITLLKSNF